MRRAKKYRAPNARNRVYCKNSLGVFEYVFFVVFIVFSNHYHQPWGARERCVVMCVRRNNNFIKKHAVKCVCDGDSVANSNVSQCSATLENIVPQGAKWKQKFAKKNKITHKSSQHVLVYIIQVLPKEQCKKRFRICVKRKNLSSSIFELFFRESPIGRRSREMGARRCRSHFFSMLAVPLIV